MAQAQGIDIREHVLTELKIALCMGLHKRLGAESEMRHLTSDNVNMIYDIIEASIPEAIHPD
jgi:hypothetical protein